MHRTKRRSLVIALACTFLSLSCKSRQFSNGKLLDATVDSGTSGDSKILLKNLAPPTDNASLEWGGMQNLLTRNPSNGDNFYSSLLKNDGSVYGVQNDFSTFIKATEFDVLAYETVLTEAAKIDKKIIVPGDLAMASVLAVLRRNRTEYALKDYEGKPNEPNLHGQSSEFGSLLSEYKYMADPSRPLLNSPCNEYDPHDYSDIKWHYYCSIPGVFRACHRLLVGSYVNLKREDVLTKYYANELSLPQLALQLASLRGKDEELVRQYCLSPNDLKDLEIIQFFQETTSRFERTYKLKPGSIQKFFRIFYDSQKDEASGVNMFDYIMRSSVYSFKFEQQQEVLNTYYGDMKPKSLGKFDPTDSADCKTYRDRRQVREVSSGGAGTHCLASTKRDVLFFNSPSGTR